MEQILKELDDSISGCLLPEQKSDIGTELFDAKHFDPFRAHLNRSLHRIFDITNDRCYKNLINELPESVRVNVALLHCEQTAKHIEFRTDQSMLVQSVEALRTSVDEYLTNAEIRNGALKWYKKRVTAATWKRNVGASHGLARFCEVIAIYAAI